MNYERFCAILNKHIFEEEKKELLQKIAQRPERFLGLFRPTKPGAKILQHLLQSHEIRLGDAIEELIEKIIEDIGFKTLDKNIVSVTGESLSLDQYFTDGKIHYFIEQKVRDDHDSTKKRGQVSNFETKIEMLHKKHKDNLVGIMYFIDPDLSKNKRYYLEELKKLADFYGIRIYLFYGKELFDYLNHSDIWDNLLLWLKKWKDGLPELPEIDFDRAPEENFEEIKDLEVSNYRKILENEKLWEEGLIRAMFRKGATLRILLDFFKAQHSVPYGRLAELLTHRLDEYFREETTPS